MGITVSSVRQEIRKINTKNKKHRFSFFIV